MSIEELYAGEAVNRENLEEIVDEALSDYEFENTTEERVRKNVLFVEAADTLERLDRESLQDTRDHLNQELDQVFTEIARKRKDQLSDNSQLGGSKPTSHLIDSFGQTEASSSLQHKYRCLDSFIENEVSAKGIVDNVFFAYVPIEQGNYLQDQIVSHLNTKVEEDQLSPSQIDQNAIEDAIRQVYSQEDYLRDDEKNVSDAAEAIRYIGPEPVEALENSDICAENTEELKKLYQQRTSELAVEIAQEIQEATPYDTAEEIYGE